MTTPLGVVHGTWADQGTPWYKRDSAWWAMMRRHNFEPVGAEDFEWSGDLVGADWWRVWFDWVPRVDNNLRRRLNDWIVTGTWLRIRYQSYGPLNWLVHSHGLHPLLIACAQGLEVNNLMSIGSPFRTDVADYIFATYGVSARQGIHYWAHVRDRDEDLIADAGGIGDKHLGFERMYRIADVNIGMEHIEHSKLLSAASEPTWEADALFEQLRAYPSQAAA